MPLFSFVVPISLFFVGGALVFSNNQHGNVNLGSSNELFHETGRTSGGEDTENNVIEAATSTPPCTYCQESYTMREKIASLRPFPVGVVFQQDPRRHPTVEAIRTEFHTIRALGFTALKQVMLINTSAAFVEAVYVAAIEEGLVPWWYGRAGWQPITPSLLASLGIRRNATMAEVQADPRMVEHQKQVMLARVRRMKAWHRPTNPIPVGRYLPLTDAEVPFFATWLADRYVIIGS